MAKQKRRTYTPEFRAEAVALVVEGGVSQSQVARDLGISQSLLSKWVQKAKVVHYRLRAVRGATWSGRQGGAGIGRSCNGCRPSWKRVRPTRASSPGSGPTASSRARPDPPRSDRPATREVL